MACDGQGSDVSGDAVKIAMAAKALTLGPVSPQTSARQVLRKQLAPAIGSGGHLPLERLPKYMVHSSGRQALPCKVLRLVGTLFFIRRILFLYSCKVEKKQCAIFHFLDNTGACRRCRLMARTRNRTRTAHHQ